MNLDLKKKQDIVVDLLKKKGVNKSPVMRVGAAVDISYSMSGHINEGRDGNRLQMTVNQLMGPALTFDDNGEIDMFKFDDRCDYVGTCGPTNYKHFVRDNNIRVRGGTAYTPIVAAAQDFFFGTTKTAVVEPAKKGLFGFGSKPAVTATAPVEKVDNSPVLMMIITDGEVSSSDKAACEKALRAATSTNIYYHFVGVGGNERSFPTIHYLADALPNVGEVYLKDFGMSDEEVYSQLICDELIQFVAKFSN